MEDTGVRIRTIRKSKRMTLRKAAGRAGLAISTLSNMERGQHAISLPNLLKIAAALEVPPSALLPEQFEVLEQRVPPDHRLRIDYEDGVTAELLTPPGDPMGLRIFLLNFKRAAEAGPATPHQGWEYVFIIDGVLEGVIGDRPAHLEAGDFVYFRADRPHALRSQGPARALMVAFATGWLPGGR